MEAVERAKQLLPDIILMDISMPEMNGIEATKQIRSLSPTTKIIILSMHDSPQVQAEARSAGADAYLTKTATAAEITRTIRKVFDGE